MAQYSDYFDRANATTLGSNWQKIGPSGGAADGDIFSNKCALASNGQIDAQWSPSGSIANQYSQATILSISLTNYLLVGVRTSGSISSDGYYAGWNGADTPTVQYSICKFNGSNPTRLALSSQLLAVSDVVKLAVEGNKLSLYVNGIGILTATDTDFSVGYPGLLAVGGATDLPVFDNWFGGSIDPYVGPTGPLGVQEQVPQINRRNTSLVY